jgi:hypothetical protein
MKNSRTIVRRSFALTTPHFLDHAVIQHAKCNLSKKNTNEKQPDDSTA